MHWRKYCFLLLLAPLFSRGLLFAQSAIPPSVRFDGTVVHALTGAPMSGFPILLTGRRRYQTRPETKTFATAKLTIMGASSFRRSRPDFPQARFALRASSCRAELHLKPSVPISISLRCRQLAALPQAPVPPATSPRPHPRDVPVARLRSTNRWPRTRITSTQPTMTSYSMRSTIRISRARMQTTSRWSELSRV